MDWERMDAWIGSAVVPGRANVMGVLRARPPLVVSAQRAGQCVCAVDGVASVAWCAYWCVACVILRLMSFRFP